MGTEPLLEIEAAGDFIVRIRPEGTIEFGPNYEPDEAARIFWQTIQDRMPPIIRGVAVSLAGEDDPAVLRRIAQAAAEKADRLEATC